MNKKVYKIISDELGRLLIGGTKEDSSGNITWVRATPKKTYWHIWCMLNELRIDKKIDTLGYRVLIDKLDTFINYIIL